MEGIVAKSHLARVVAFVPFRVAIVEEDVLTSAVNLPVHEWLAVVAATDAILRIIILISVVRIEPSAASAGRITGQVRGQPGIECV